MEYAELPKVAKETCYEHDWQGIGECPECVDAWATALAERTVPEDTAVDDWLNGRELTGGTSE